MKLKKSAIIGITIGGIALTGTATTFGFVLTRNAIDQNIDSSNVEKTVTSNLQSKHETINRDDPFVTKEKNNHFKERQLPKGFTLPDSIKKIGSNAFEDATSPEGFTIPSGTKVIGNDAFKGAVLPEGLTIKNDVVAIDERTLQKATSPKEFGVPESITTTLSKHTNVYKVDFEKQNNKSEEKIINSLSFDNDKKVVSEKKEEKSFNKQKSWKSNQQTMMLLDNQLMQLSSPSKNHLAKYEIKNGTNKENWINYVNKQNWSKTFKERISKKIHWINDSEAIILKFAFHEADDLKIPQGFIIPNGVINIGYAAFRYATLPKSFTIPNSVISIGRDAFQEAILPKKFTIPNSVTSIGENAFFGANLPKEFNIPNSVKIIGAGAFAGYLSYDVPKAPFIPKSVKSIGEWAFGNTFLPEGFTIPHGVTNMSDNTFGLNAIEKGCTWFDENGQRKHFSYTPRPGWSIKKINHDSD